MKTIDIEDASRPLSEYARELLEGAVIITEKGKPTAALLPVGGADIETISLSLKREFIDLIERSRARHEDSGGISSEEMRRRLGLKRRAGKKRKKKKPE